jgi:hypothetical protein
MSLFTVSHTEAVISKVKQWEEEEADATRNPVSDEGLYSTAFAFNEGTVGPGVISPLAIKSTVSNVVMPSPRSTNITF